MTKVAHIFCALLLSRSLRLSRSFSTTINNHNVIITTHRRNSRSLFLQYLSTRKLGESSKLILCRLKSSEVASNYNEDLTLSWESKDEEMEEGGDSWSISSEKSDQGGDTDVDGTDDRLQIEFDLWSEALEKAMKALSRKQDSLESELGKAQNVEKLSHRAQLIVSNLYLFTSPRIKSVVVNDWEKDGEEVELTLDPKYDSASAEADALFIQARKLKRGSKVIGDLLLETSDSLELLLGIKTDLNSLPPFEDDDFEAGFGIIKNRLSKSSKRTKFSPPSLEKREKSKNKMGIQRRGVMETSVRKLMSPGGCIVYVGRNRRGNEHLSMQVARGKDIWMHSRGCPGAHVILQHRRGSPEPTEECLQFCADLAAFYSDARNEQKASVTAAEPKHVLKPRGAPLGAVKLREELYTLIGRPDKVPEELKIARAQSGLSDDFRSKDKAKHRKFTKSQAKKRSEQRAKEKKKRRSSN